MRKRQRRKREKLRRHEPRQRRDGIARQLATGAGLTVGATLLVGGVAQAAPITYTVGSLADTTGATDCATPTNTDCTLRQAITDADSNSGADMIVFRSGLTGTITLTGGQLYISDPLTIQGPGASQVTVSGNNASRVFVVSGVEQSTSPELSTISGLTITAGDSGDFDGGGIYATFSGLTVSDSVVTDNHSGRNGAGIEVEDAVQGGESLTITSSTISGNSSDFHGGGVEGFYTPTTIRSSTISGNSSGRGGGADFTGYALAAVENSTIYGNTASAGGGLYHHGGYGPDRTLIATGSTISHNSATRGGGIACYGATFNGNTVGTPILRNTIVSGNNAASADQGNDLSCDLDNNPGNAGRVQAAFSLLGSVDPGTPIDETPPGSDIFGQDPLLGPLDSNGGPTQTMAPRCDSPAIDKGSAFGLTEDQRDLPRPVELGDYPNSSAVGADGSDIGAVELQTSPGTGCTPPPPPATSTATKDRKCTKLRKKRKRQQKRLAKVATEAKRAMIRANLKDTERRLKKLSC